MTTERPTSRTEAEVERKAALPEVDAYAALAALTLAKVLEMVTADRFTAGTEG